MKKQVYETPTSENLILAPQNCVLTVSMDSQTENYENYNYDWS